MTTTSSSMTLTVAMANEQNKCRNDIVDLEKRVALLENISSARSASMLVPGELPDTIVPGELLDAPGAFNEDVKKQEEYIALLEKRVALLEEENNTLQTNQSLMHSQIEELTKNVVYISKYYLSKNDYYKDVMRSFRPL